MGVDGMLREGAGEKAEKTYAGIGFYGVGSALLLSKQINKWTRSIRHSTKRI